MQNSKVFSLQAKIFLSISNNSLQSKLIFSFKLLHCLAFPPHTCRRERTLLGLGVLAAASLLMPVWGAGLVSRVGRGDGAAALRPLPCVSPCISRTALALFSSAELRQQGVIACVSPPIFLMSTALISQAASGVRASKRTGLVHFFLLPKNMFGFCFPSPPIIR